MLKLPYAVTAEHQHALLVRNASNVSPVQDSKVARPPRKTHKEMLLHFKLLQLELFPETEDGDDLYTESEPLSVVSDEAEYLREIQLKADDVDPMDDPSNWSNQGFSTLAEGMIDWHIRRLLPEVPVRFRIEALQWLFEPAQTLVISPKGTQKYIPTFVIPFSFRNLCLLSGFDADALLDSLYEGFKKSGQMDVLTQAGITDGEAHVSTYH